VANDQGGGLVDSALARKSAGGGTRFAEVLGGCFCCRLGELVAAMKTMEDGPEAGYLPGGAGGELHGPGGHDAAAAGGWRRLPACRSAWRP
jgi:hypothetical protein